MHQLSYYFFKKYVISIYIRAVLQYRQGCKFCFNQAYVFQRNWEKNSLLHINPYSSHFVTLFLPDINFCLELFLQPEELSLTFLVVRNKFLIFIYLKISLFHLHSARKFSQSTGFWVDRVFVSPVTALKKYSTVFWPPLFLMWKFVSVFLVLVSCIIFSLTQAFSLQLWLDCDVPTNGFLCIFPIWNLLSLVWPALGLLSTQDYRCKTLCGQFLFSGSIRQEF